MADDLVDRLQRLREAALVAERLKARRQGDLERAREELRVAVAALEEFGVSSVEEARERLVEVESRLAEAISEVESRVKEVAGEFGGR